MLPHEAEVTVEIENKYRAQLQAMTALHEAVIGMLTVGSWKIGKPGLKLCRRGDHVGAVDKSLQDLSDDPDPV